MAEPVPILVAPKRGRGWPAAVTQPIAAPKQDVWGAISMPGNLGPCHPFCARNPVLRWPGAESLDEIHYLNGWIFERRFGRWIDGVGYDLEIGRRGGRSSFVEWRILDSENQEDCALRITVYPHTLQRVPVPIRWLAHMLYVRPRLKEYLSSVTRGFEWYVTRGEPVPRNQFGVHPWFSGPKSHGAAYNSGGDTSSGGRGVS